MIRISLLFILLFNHGCLFAQCLLERVTTFSDTLIGGIQVNVTSFGDVGAVTNYCFPFTSPYLIGADYTIPNHSGGYSFHFTPPINKLSINFGGIHNNNGWPQEIIKISVNNIHYIVSQIGTFNNCDDLAVLTASGDITGNPNGNSSGWIGTSINGTISDITIMDSIVQGSPGGTVFSLFICSRDLDLIAKDENESISIYPIPSNSQMIIEGLKSTNIFLSLIDYLGHKQNLPYRRESNKVIIDVSNIENGLYLLELEEETRRISKRIAIY
jgi:hypothetical protein